MSLNAALDAFRSEIMAHVPQGGWCPYCNLELRARALQQALPEITRLGATLVAVSPQTPDESLSTAEKNALAFPVLSDAGSANGDESWVLPIPATYVIDTHGTIALAYVDVDYRNGLESTEILTARQSLSKNCKGEHHANISR